MQSQSVQVDSCHSSDRKSPPPDGAFQVSGCRQSNGLQMEDAACVLPRGSFHTTSAPSLFFCLIRSLSPALPPSSRLTGCSADGGRGHSDSYSTCTRMERASVEGLYVSVSICIISGDNWPDQDDSDVNGGFHP